MARRSKRPEGFDYRRLYPSQPTTERARAMFDTLLPVDRIASQMENKWGFGRLPEIVSAETRAKYERVRGRLDDAITADNLELAAHEAAIMFRAWHALDAEAEQLGAGGPPASVWTVVGADGAYKVVPTDLDKAALDAAAEHGSECVRHVSVEELLRLYEAEGLRSLREIKALFPGATVEDVRPINPGSTLANAGITKPGVDRGDGALFEHAADRPFEDQIPF